MGRLQGKKILIIIAPDKFRDEELNHPKEVFHREEASVTIASTSVGEAKGMFGARVAVSYLIKDVNYNDYDALVIVGGMGSPDYLWGDSDLNELVINSQKAGKIVAAICLSGVVLARAGILNGVEATVYRTSESMSEYSKHGVKYVSKDVVQSGKIITADGPAAARNFGNTIADAIIGN